jgi:hypothetical protein
MRSDRTTPPWIEPPLFTPDAITIEFRLSIDKLSDTVWGGLRVLDFETNEPLAITAEAFPGGLIAVSEALKQMLTIAAAHLEHGGPFPA